MSDYVHSTHDNRNGARGGFGNCFFGTVHMMLGTSHFLVLILVLTQILMSDLVLSEFS